MTHDPDTTTPPLARVWRITSHLTTKLGAFGATAAVLIGACGPAVTQCAPTPAPTTTTTTTTIATPPLPESDIRLVAKPVQAPCTFTDTWGAARSGGRTHLGTDITAAQGQEVYAVATGEISKVYTEGIDALAGNGIQLHQPDGTFWFYAHMLQLAPGVAVGTPVTAGQLVGWVGMTGNAGGPHLHLELHPGGGSAINSYPIIVASGGAC